MGLTGFYQLLAKHYTPQTCSREEFIGKTVAVDGDYICYSILHGSTQGETVDAQHIATLIIDRLLAPAKMFGIEIIFVVSGPEVIPEKQHTTQKRKKVRETLLVKSHTLQKKRTRDGRTQMELLVQEVQDEIKSAKLKSSARHISRQTSQSIAQHLTARNYDCRTAVSEADFYLSYLSETNQCDFVATEDADILLSGAKQTVRKFMSVLTDGETPVNTFNRMDVLQAFKSHVTTILRIRYHDEM